MSGAKLKCRRKTRTAPALGIAGLSFSLASGAYGANATPATDMLSGNPVRIQAVTIRGEEIFDVSLATFSLLDKENVRAQRLLAPPDKMAWGGCVPGGLYYSETPPTIGRPVYQTPAPNGHRQIRRAHKHARRKP